jgi:magnesium transporter
VTEVLTGLDAGDRERIAALRAQGRFFWLDASLSETSREELVDVLGVSERAVRGPSRVHADGASVDFVLRCYVATERPADEGAYRLRPIQVQVVVTGDYLLTLHEERVALPAVLAIDLPQGRSKGYVVYSVLDAMLVSASDALEEVEDSLDRLAASLTGGGGGGVPRERLQMPVARLATMRRWVRAEQAVFQRVGLDIGALSGFDEPEERYLARLDEQADRLLESIDAASNVMGMVLDLQLNERAYLVSVVATIFVPLTFITGFFGMNFGWMVDRIDTQVAFWLLGFVIPAATAVLAWRLLVRRVIPGGARRSARWRRTT